MASDVVGANLAWSATFNGEQDVWFLRLGEWDCNANGVGDSTEIASGAATDWNYNGIPDGCEGLQLSDNAAPAAPHRLLQNAPNPCNPTTVIPFDMPAPAAVRLRLFDVAGRPVRTLVRDAQAGGMPSPGMAATTRAGRWALGSTCTGSKRRDSPRHAGWRWSAEAAGWRVVPERGGAAEHPVRELWLPVGGIPAAVVQVRIQGGAGARGTPGSSRARGGTPGSRRRSPASRAGPRCRRACRGRPTRASAPRGPRPSRAPVATHRRQAGESSGCREASTHVPCPPCDIPVSAMRSGSIRYAFRTARRQASTRSSCSSHSESSVGFCGMTTMHGQRSGWARRRAQSDLGRFHPVGAAFSGAVQEHDTGPLLRAVVLGRHVDGVGEGPVVQANGAQLEWSSGRVWAGILRSGVFTPAAPSASTVLMAAYIARTRTSFQQMRGNCSPLSRSTLARAADAAFRSTTRLRRRRRCRCGSPRRRRVRAQRARARSRRRGRRSHQAPLVGHIERDRGPGSRRRRAPARRPGWRLRRSECRSRPRGDLDQGAGQAAAGQVAQAVDLDAGVQQGQPPARRAARSRSRWRLSNSSPRAPP